MLGFGKLYTYVLKHDDLIFVMFQLACLRKGELGLWASILILQLRVPEAPTRLGWTQGILNVVSMGDVEVRLYIQPVQLLSAIRMS